MMKKQGYKIISAIGLSQSKVLKIGLLFLFLTNSAIAQVGVNTTEPTKDLDINGELRVRNLPGQDLSTSSLLTTDEDGNIGKTITFILSDVNSVVAAGPVTLEVDGKETVNNIDLGLSVTVTIPANKESIVIINYSVPVGIPDFSRPESSYYGVRFLKDGVEAPAGSRKFTVTTVEDGAVGNTNMVSISNLYTESFAPSPTERTIVYTLNGYIEQAVGKHEYRFNMWSSSPPNFNWGRATLSKQVYIK